MPVLNSIYTKWRTQQANERQCAPFEWLRIKKLIWNTSVVNVQKRIELVLRYSFLANWRKHTLFILTMPCVYILYSFFVSSHSCVRSCDRLSVPARTKTPIQKSTFWPYTRNYYDEFKSKNLICVMLKTQMHLIHNRQQQQQKIMVTTAAKRTKVHWIVWTSSEVSKRAREKERERGRVI